MPRGFSLVEVVVATGIMCAATIAIVQLSIMSVRVNRVARSATLATVLAAQKMEQLQSAGWTELTASPSDALARSTDGYCEYLDENGRMLGGGPSWPAGAIFVRRWALDRLADREALLIQIVVVPVSGAGRGVAGRGPGEARIVGIKTRH